MPATKIYDVKVKTREYEYHGEKKSYWESVGSVYKNDETGYVSIQLRRTFNPAGIPVEAGQDSVWLACFKPKPKDDNGGPGSNGGAWAPPPEMYEAPADDMNIRFKDGPAGAANDTDIPF